MKTNHKSNPLLMFSIVFMLLSSHVCFGQWGIIKEIQERDAPAKELEIRLTPPKGNSISKVVKVGDTIYSGSIITAPKRTLLTIISKNNNIREIRGNLPQTYQVSNNKEDQRVFPGEDTEGSVFNKVLTQVNGGVNATSAKNDASLKTTTTEFLVTAEGNHLTFDLLEGKVVINRRVKICLNEDMAIDSTGKRDIYVNEPQKLTLKNSRYSHNPDSLLQKTLDSEDQIESFFKKQLGEQLRTVLNASKDSRAAIKSIKAGNDSLAIQTFEKAISNGELRRDLFIESALLLSEAYLREGNKDFSASWLNISLYFSQQELDDSQELFDHYLEIGEPNIAKSYGSDLVIANQYYAWAYTVKLKLNRCLETGDQNPRAWLKKAENIKQQLDKL